MSTKYWVIVASRGHVLNGVAAGIAQANHGKPTALRRMHANDWVIYYSPKLVFGEAEKCQAFTAIGRFKDENIYQVDMGGGFVPYRRDVEYLPCVETSILPLIDSLDFIPDKQHWGGPFRFGSLQIHEPDFQRIAERMSAGQSWSPSR
jgi:hypothetical protein